MDFKATVMRERKGQKKDIYANKKMLTKYMNGI